jgi:hypothetical protein
LDVVLQDAQTQLVERQGERLIFRERPGHGARLPRVPTLVD